MLIQIPYSRDRALEYTRKWALARNPLFIDFAGVGGDCTNFVSQCIFAGFGFMNYTPTYGWYYISSFDRAPSWTGVNELYNFLTGKPEFTEANGSTGPYGVSVRRRQDIEVGDVIQLGNAAGEFYHSLIVSGFDGTEILVSAHSNDVLDRPLSRYSFSMVRAIHIEGARMEYDYTEIYENLLDGISLPPHEPVAPNM
ncbi:MAG: amidase domain-containing protein [Eubacteriales bacterium]